MTINEEKVDFPKAEASYSNLEKDDINLLISLLGEYNEKLINLCEKIEDNNVRISELKENIKNDKSALKSVHEKQVIDLQARNNDLKMRLDNYKGEGEDKWEDFKKEFEHDMNEIGSSLKDLTVSNTK